MDPLVHMGNLQSRYVDSDSSQELVCDTKHIGDATVASDVLGVDGAKIVIDQTCTGAVDHRRLCIHNSE